MTLLHAISTLGARHGPAMGPQRASWTIVAAIGLGLVSPISLAASKKPPPDPGTVASLAKGQCSAGAPYEVGTSEHSMSFDGMDRSYRLHVPESYSPQRRAPVVIVLHGGLGTGKYIQKQSQMTPVSERHGFIGVFPDGRFRSFNAGRCCGRAMKKNVDDVGFIMAILDRLEAQMCIDTRRVYATGFSNGAMLAHRLACDAADRIAAIAPVSGVSMVNSCSPSRPVPTIVFHGRQDPRSLWQGGLGNKDPRLGVRASIADTMSTLRSRASCTPQMREFLRRGDALCTSTRGCAGDAEVALCAIDNHGHQWPGGREVKLRNKDLGPMSTDISASEVMWEFFSRHPMP